MTRSAESGQGAGLTISDEMVSAAVKVLVESGHLEFEATGAIDLVVRQMLERAPLARDEKLFVALEHLAMEVDFLPDRNPCLNRALSAAYKALSAYAAGAARAPSVGPPREPTPAMLAASSHIKIGIGKFAHGQVWRAMYDAASPPAAAEPRRPLLQICGGIDDHPRCMLPRYHKGPHEPATPSEPQAREDALVRELYAVRKAIPEGTQSIAKAGHFLDRVRDALQQAADRIEADAKRIEEQTEDADKWYRNWADARTRAETAEAARDRAVSLLHQAIVQWDSYQIIGDTVARLIRAFLAATPTGSDDGKA